MVEIRSGGSVKILQKINVPLVFRGVRVSPAVLLSVGNLIRILLADDWLTIGSLSAINGGRTGGGKTPLSVGYFYFRGGNFHFTTFKINAFSSPPERGGTNFHFRGGFHFKGDFSSFCPLNFEG